MRGGVTLTEIERATPVTVDIDTLKYLGYDPNNVATRALVLLAQRYNLDPLLGEITLISDRNGRKLYVTRDGMLAVAHASGQLNGIEVTEQRRNSTGDGWTAYVSVWRKDMEHPFHYGAQCKDNEAQAKAGNGPEMALARAERRALKRAFRIRSDFYPERPYIEDEDTDLSPPGEGAPREVSITRPPAAPSIETQYTEGDVSLMTPDQRAKLLRLRVQLGLMARENAGAWLQVLSQGVGRPVDETYAISRIEAEQAITFLTAELTEQAQALADAQRAEADYIEDPAEDEGGADDGDGI